MDTLFNGGLDVESVETKKNPKNWHFNRSESKSFGFVKKTGDSMS
jgi:hypothetical protein